MARIVVSTVVSRDAARFRRTFTHFQKNAGTDFELWLTDIRPDDERVEEPLNAHRVFEYGMNLGYPISQNMVLDALERDVPDFLVLLDPDLDIHSRRILKKLIERAQATGFMTQPRIERGYKQKVLASVDDMEVVDVPDPRFLVIPYPAIADFRFDHFAPVASHDEKRLGIHMAVTKQVSTLRVKHKGSGYQYLQEKDDVSVAMEAKKVLGYAG
jgi:hypothetical protein